MNTEEAICHMQEGYLRQVELLAKMHEAELRVGEDMENAWKEYAAEVGHPPTTDLEKRQAFLNYLVRRGWA